MLDNVVNGSISLSCTDLEVPHVQESLIINVQISHTDEELLSWVESLEIGIRLPKLITIWRVDLHSLHDCLVFECVHHVLAVARNFISELLVN